jgi:hypothetical protein
VSGLEKAEDGQVSMAPRRTEIDLNELERLCAIQCTDEEIAAWFRVSTRTIERRRLEPEFAEVMIRGRAKGRISVRRMQMKMLEEGNATMGVWLGKQILGQADQVSLEINVLQLGIISPDRTTGQVEGPETLDIDSTR